MREDQFKRIIPFMEIQTKNLKGIKIVVENVRIRDAIDETKAKNVKANVG